ncbi:AGAP008193-PA-like protein [Anopheles sinensis]|uniref:AGAP008193-PA-like protein n=1 Tax=Anopheles sinensis TaxID=74873 RepID=A0A084WDK6_ANOSI|nr:AGAP008193-PA-like protein [Anopheles sinensis]
MKIVGAAHCLYTFNRLMHKDQITVHVGRERLNGTTYDVQKLNVYKLIVHPEFQIGKMSNDIAIIKLDRDITMTAYVQPVCIWSFDDGHREIVDKNGTLVGFGLNEHDQQSGMLQEATMTVVDVYTCLESDRRAYGPVLARNMYCAGGTPGVSACNGDSGGGMFFAVNNTWYLRGIVSFIPMRLVRMCDSSKYTVFTDVSKYRHWIASLTIMPWGLSDLEPCRSELIDEDTICNAENGFDHGFLVLGDLNGVMRVPLNGGRYIKDFHNSTPLVGIDRDCVGGRIYWTDYKTKQILSAKYDGTDQKPFISKDFRHPWSIAVDWISRRIYWADSYNIEVASLDNPDVRTVLINNAYYSYGLAVDVNRGKLYWMTNLEISMIEWSNLDGTERQVLIGRPQIERPYYIRVSIVTGELCCQNGESIVCIDPYTKQIRTIVSNITDVDAFTLTEELFYWTNGKTDQLESIDPYGVRQKPIKFTPMETYVFEMVAVTDKCPVFHSPCATNNGGCPMDTICLVNQHIPSGKNCTKIVKK